MLETEIEPYFTPVRRDFAFDTRCYACNVLLRSNIAVFIRHGQGTEHPYGPTCAERLVKESVHQIPDLTSVALPKKRGMKSGVPHEDAAVSTKSLAPRDKLRRASPDEMATRTATSYLLLRMMALRDLPGVYYGPLVDLFERWQDSQLTVADVAHINNIEAKCRRERPKYSLPNLATVYAFDRALAAALDHVDLDRQDFLVAVRRNLRRNLFLSAKEVMGIARWLRKIPRQPELDPGAFVWAWKDLD